MRWHSRTQYTLSAGPGTSTHPGTHWWSICSEGSCRLEVVRYNDRLGSTSHQGRRQATCLPALCKLQKHVESGVLCQCQPALENWNLRVVISCTHDFTSQHQTCIRLQRNDNITYIKNALRCTRLNAPKVRELTYLFILSRSACGGVPKILWILCIWSSSLFPNPPHNSFSKALIDARRCKLMHKRILREDNQGGIMLKNLEKVERGWQSQIIRSPRPTCPSCMCNSHLLASTRVLGTFIPESSHILPNFEKIPFELVNKARPVVFLRSSGQWHWLKNYSESAANKCKKTENRNAYQRVEMYSVYGCFE